MRARFLIAILVFAALGLCGCAKQDKLIGTWTGKWQTVDIVQTFAADGTYKTSGTINAPGMPKPINMEMAGTFTHEGDKLTLTPTSFDMPGVDPAIKGMVESQAKSQMMKPETATITWASDDEFEIKGASGLSKLTRKK